MEDGKGSRNANWPMQAAIHRLVDTGHYVGSDLRWPCFPAVFNFTFVLWVGHTVWGLSVVQRLIARRAEISGG